ncbi:hypothetical protein DPMN_160616 [Dreissena polymorpha]|uniref:Uncharacterized protein n=1 Tax=Dreissena polymorpha TaxID=45954 RepID=A0A9D4ELV6_DREPO|nr:hypothetical protein DPMN_160616 [Dreissena polymorpha]
MTVSASSTTPLNDAEWANRLATACEISVNGGPPPVAAAWFRSFETSALAFLV